MRYTIVFLFLSGFNGLIYAQNTHFADSILNQQVYHSSFAGLASGIVKGDEVIWKGTIGFSDINDSIPFSIQTKTRIASLVKPMTAVAIMQLYERGLLDLDAEIQRYIPDYPQKEKGNFTIRQLMGHRSGTPSYNGMKEINNLLEYNNTQAAVDHFKERPLISTPGNEYRYTSYGYVILGLVIENVSGMSYESYMRTNIWDPLGMSSTGIEDYSRQYPGKSELYNRDGKGRFSLTQKTNLSDRVPGGGVYSTLEDVLKFGMAILNNSLIQHSTLEMMLIPLSEVDDNNNYGLGWSMYTEKQGYHYAFGHSGSQRGGSGQLIIAADQNVCIISLCNTGNANKEISRLDRSLYQGLLNQLKD